MPSRRSGGDLVLFNSTDPRPLVNWLCETYGLATILQSVAEFRPSGSQQEAPAKRASKRRGRRPGAKKGSKRRGRPPGSKNKGAGKRRGRPPGSGKKQAEGGAGGNG